LAQIIESAGGVEPWRAAIVKYPEVISYCEKQAIRRGELSDEIYLLTKTQMNGYHAELFSYVLYLELDGGGARHDLAPLSLQSYYSVSMTEREPHLLLVLDRSKHRVQFFVESANGQFRIHTSCAELDHLPEVEAALRVEAMFVQEGQTLMRFVPRADIHKALRQLGASLAKLPNPIY